MLRLHQYPADSSDRRKRGLHYINTVREKMLQWLPDGRDVSAYPVPGETSLYQWAWEFMRRDPCYQFRYTILSEIPSEHEAGHFRESFCHTYHFDPYWLEGKTLNEYSMPRIRELINTKRSDFIKQFWLARFSPELNPSLNSHPEFSVPAYPLALDDILGRGGYVSAEIPLMFEYPCETTYTFSLADDIDSQVEIVTNHLKEARADRLQKQLWIDDNTLKDYVPESHEMYLLYLRLLDAEANGVYDQITWNSHNRKDAIAIDECNFEQIKRTASSLVEGGYRYLLRMAEEADRESRRSCVTTIYPRPS